MQANVEAESGRPVSASRWRHATRVWLSIGLAATSVAVSAQGPTPANVQAIEHAEQEAHQRIESERSAAEKRYAAQELACRQRFVVSSCIEDAKRVRRATLQPLRERQIEIDTARRKRVSAERSQSIAKKAADEGAKAGVSMSSRAGRKASAMPAATGLDAGPSITASGVATGAASEVVSAKRATPARAGKVPPPSKPIKLNALEPRVADEAGNRAAFATRQEAAAQHRRDVEARNAAQVLKRKPAAPLASVSAPRTVQVGASGTAAGGSKPAR